MASVTPLRISLPSTLARRSRISKSANLLAPFLHLICAVRRVLSHPRRALHRSAQQALVHLLFVLARQRGPRRHVLDRTVAVPDREAASRKLDDLSHVPVLGREPGQLAYPAFEIESGEARRVLGLEAGGPALKEPLQLLLAEKLHKVAGKLPVPVGEMLRRRGRQRIDVFRPAAAMRLGVRHTRQTFGFQRLQVLQRRLLGDLQMARDIAEGGVTPGFQESEDDLAARVHEIHPTSFSTLSLKYHWRAVRRLGASAAIVCLGLAHALAASAAGPPRTVGGPGHRLPRDRLGPHANGAHSRRRTGDRPT